jgi:hypothetical protein
MKTDLGFENTCRNMGVSRWRKILFAATRAIQMW